MQDFLFPDGQVFEHGAVRVRICGCHPAADKPLYVPSYSCAIHRASDDAGVGMIACRIGHNELIDRYAGHIGYGIDEAYRGHGYAAQACLAVGPLFRAHDYDHVWITCNPDNWPSRKTLERIGAELVEIVDLPEWTEMHQHGERQKCRYRWSLSA